MVQGDAHCRITGLFFFEQAADQEFGRFLVCPYLVTVSDSDEHP
jgi:hypothetical protein